MIKYILSIIIIVVSIYFSSCNYNYSSDNSADIFPDTIKAVTLSSSTTYFEYRNVQMGYQFDLFKLFCHKINHPYKVSVVSNNYELFKAITNGDADVCITPIAPTKVLKNQFNFVGTNYISGMVLVQRIPNYNKNFIHSVAEFVDDTITVPIGTRYYYRLKHINSQLSGRINIETVDQDSLLSEDIIRLVSSGKVKYTITDELLAKLSSTYYNNIDISVDVGFSQKLSWIVSKNKKKLADSINIWAMELSEQNVIRGIYKSYFEKSKGFFQDNMEDVILVNGHLTPYDDYFKEESERIGWRWTLLAAIAWQESRFKADIIGWSGARGLMGIMPSSGKIYNISKDDLLDPKISIKTAVNCIRDITKYLQIKEIDDNAISIILAGYNAGIGHVYDAQRLAKKLGYNPNIWVGNIEECIRLKKNPKYYNDSVCKNGYLNSDETIEYVKKVLIRDKEYQEALLPKIKYL